MRDLVDADDERRRTGAYLRLAYWYPDAIERPVLEVLAKPTWSVFTAFEVAHEQLYRTGDRERRKRIVDAAIERHGPGLGFGLRDRLFEDLGLLEAREAGRRAAKFDAFTTQPRELLRELFGYPPDVRAAQRPPIDTALPATTLARFIEALVHDDSPKITATVLSLFEQARKHDAHLAFGCFERLHRAGETERLRGYCRELLAAKRDDYEVREAGRRLERLK